MPRPTVADRLAKWTSPEPNTGCWLWTGAVDGGGYGVIGIGSRNVKAHRAHYEMAVCKISVGKVLLHTCDNPGCVNPKHLVEGTQKDNVADMIAKGRNFVLPEKYRFG